MIGNKQNNIGFTLMEVMISAGLFIIIIMAGTGIYISISSVQKANVAGQKVYTESRFLLDMIANDIKSNAINYQTGYPSSLPETVLNLLKDDTQVKYWQDSSSGHGILKQQIGTDPEISISSSSIDITKLQFYIYPMVQSTKAVPFVTIVWQAKEAGDAILNPMTVNLQTAVSVRNY